AQNDIVTEPVYNLPAIWIDPALRERAQEFGALVFDPISILGSHLAEIARQHAAELVGRQELQTLLEHLRSTVPTLVKEIGNDGIPLAALHRAFTLLLRERVWPRDPVAVLEAMLEAGTRDARGLAEAARRAIVPAQIRRRGTTLLAPIVLEPSFERELTRSWAGDSGIAGAPDPADALEIRARVENYLAGRPQPPTLVCTAALRPLLADFLDRCGQRIDVFSYSELPPDLQLEPAAVIDRKQHAVANGLYGE